MSAFSAIHPEARYLLTGLMFLAAISQLALCLYQHICDSSPRRRLVDGTLLAALVCLCAYLSAASGGSSPAPFPWALVVLLAALAFLRAGTGIWREYQRSLRTLSPASVKQALDNLNSGVLFADETGRVVLVNYAMGRLTAALLGGYPQTLDGLTQALTDIPRRSEVEKIDEAPALYRFPDGRVWRFQTAALTEPSLAGFTQTTAQDMTELSRANAQLSEENAALRAAIQKTREMAEGLADLIPKQEALNLKIRIHNDIGASLIALSELLEHGDQEDAEAQIEKLGRALIPFGSAYPVTDDSLEAVRRQAAEMNVSLVVEGTFPAGPEERLIAAAARECVTNCIRHAGGKTVWVVITERSGLTTAIFTNDGRPPEGPIKEGGGLSSLRRSVENAGGEMSVFEAPRFTLVLNLPEGRYEE